MHKIFEAKNMMRGLSRRVLAKFGQMLATNPLKKSLRVVLYPDFESEKLADDHLNRLRWYLPGTKDKQVNIALRVLGDENELGTQPPHSARYESRFHSQARVEGASYHEAIRSADLVLLWSLESRGKLEEILGLRVKPVVEVDLENSRCVEFGNYAKLSWIFGVSSSLKRKLARDSRRRLRAYVSSIPAKKKVFALVLGTGPSFERYSMFDRQGGIVIACNSAVSDPDFLRVFRPDFITFGDAAHHAGPSLRAHKFRKELLFALELLPDLRVLSTAHYYPMFSKLFARFENRFIWLSQGNRKPNYNLVSNPLLPSLASTMNIHMLPLAATVAHDIFILGVDGKSLREDENEDFWGHSKKLAYGEQLDCFHVAHPTYDRIRTRGSNGRGNVLSEYEHSASATISGGEEIGIRYFILAKSSSPTFEKRRLPFSEFTRGLEPNGKISLRSLIENETTGGASC